MEVIQNFTSPVATWYQYQPAGQMGSVFIKNSKDDTCFPKKIEFYGIKNRPPPHLNWPQILSCYSGLNSFTG